MWGYAGAYDPSASTNYVSSQPGYDQYASNVQSNYVSTDPMNNAYGSSGSSGFNSSGLWGAAINGVAGYAQQQAASDAAADQQKLSAQEQLDQLKQQREYQTQDKDYHSAAVAKWKNYFQG